MHAWELHPALVHYPIAFLTGAVLIDLVARLSPRDCRRWTRVAAGLLAAGVASGVAAVAAGMVSYFTVPAHTEAAHERMHAHVALAAGALAVFALVAAARWRRRELPPSAAALVGAVVGCALLVGAAVLGGTLVYRGGAGVDPRILAPEIVEGHHHGSDGEHRGHNHGADGDHEGHHHGTDGDHDHAAPDEAAARPGESSEPRPRALGSGRTPVRPERPLFDPDEDLRPAPGVR